MKSPLTFAINSLMLLPGTTIYDMGEAAGFTKKQEKITLASYVNFMPTELNLTLAFYNIARVPDFWLRRVLAKNYGERTVAMQQYPRLGRIIGLLGLFKKIVQGISRKDISALPAPSIFSPANGWYEIAAGAMARFRSRANLSIRCPSCSPPKRARWLPPQEIPA